MLLLFATLFWGFGFVATRWTLIEYSDLWSNSLRFLIAGSIALLFLIKDKKLIINPKIIICSLLLGTGLQLQTFGIGMTTLAKSGFFTVFYAFFTPLFSALFFKEKIKMSYWILLLIALIGICLICEFKIDNFNLGDLFILISALFFSFHIIATDLYARNFPSVKFNLAQCVILGFFCTIFGTYIEGVPNLQPLLNFSTFSSAKPLLGFLFLAIFSSLIAFSFQVVAQKKIRPHIVSIMFLLESVFSAFFGFIIFNETLSYLSMAGCFLLLLSVGLIPKFSK